MASILNSKAKFYVSHSNEEASHFIQSEGNLFIRELSQKQNNVDLTLEKHLEQEKEFKISHSYKPVTEFTCGATTYEDFKKLSSNLEEKIVNNAEENISQNKTKYVSRHLRELALSVKPNSLETKLLQFALSCNAVGSNITDNRPADHPINHLPEIQDELFGHLSTDSNSAKTVKTVLRKRKQLLEEIFDSTIGPKVKCNPSRENSLWDVTETSVNAVNNLQKKTRIFTCKNKKLFTIRDGCIVEMNGKNTTTEQRSIEKTRNAKSFISSSNEIIYDDKLRSRLTEDEIRKIPKFCNYEKGIPSQVLYLKNLSPSVNGEDLLSLFGKYQRPDKPRIIYTIMQKGKMRGQAFVNFHCTETAMKAMEEVNGTVIREKPLIMHFSTSRDKSSSIT